MQLLRYFTNYPLNALRSILRIKQQQVQTNLQVRRSHDSGPPQPFDNLPFRVNSRYMLTAFFSVFYGLGLWAPYIIVWYSMAKRTL